MFFLISLTYCADFGKQSEAGTMQFETGDSRAAFAALSAALFPLIPTWLGTLQKIISLFFLILVCSSKILRIIGFGVQISCMACRADFESVKII